MADWTAESDFGASRENIFRSRREGVPLRAEPRFVEAEEEPALSPGAAALARYNAGLAAPVIAKARLAVWVGGGALSLLLLGSAAVWGYKLVLREVMGLPVVLAEEGPMRVLPVDPEGEVVPSQGLAVNAIPGEGIAAPPSDMLVLAPQAPGLAAEDMEVVQTTAEEGEVVPVVSAVATDPLALVEEGSAPAAPAATAAAPAEPVPESPEARAVRLVASVLPADRALTPEEVVALAEQIARGEEPVIPPAAPVETAAVVAAPAPAAPAEAQVAALAPAPEPAAPAQLRPVPRPAARSAPAATFAAAPAVTAAPVEAAPLAEPVAVASAPLPAGTNLVQLGAFDSAEIAAAEWDRLQTRFGDFLGPRARVIQETQSNGRTFWRLRATGFTDRAEARALCAALTAEGAACIPVTVDG